MNNKAINADNKSNNSQMYIDWHIDIHCSEINLDDMSAAANAAMKAEHIGVSCSVSVRICDDETIRNYNRIQRGIDRPTDILSFPAVSYPNGITAGYADKLLRMEYDDDSNTCFLGDLIISAPRIIAQSNEYGHSIRRESAYILVHGLLHLFGYDHICENDRMIMRHMEETIMDMCHLYRS